ncbi:PAS domain-containing sensor histidine kinase [Candidatus Eisenbacteria bacterium]|uniref:histidine kinase n=1 Tax=Eiseniibacteriota bacterium TaxID=2212470 RepID=A0ABV6YIX6_UNCEI
MSSLTTLPAWVYAILFVFFFLAAIYVIRSLRGSSRLQRRLFLLFLLLSFVPAATILLVNWQMSKRNLSYLDSPGLRSSIESSLNLARHTLEGERQFTQAIADSLAVRIERFSNPRPTVPPGCSYGVLDDEDAAADVSSHMHGFGEGFPTLGAIEWRDIETPIRVEAGESSFLVAKATISTPEKPDRYLLLARQIETALAADLDAVARGSSRQRQLRLFYGDLLRGNTVLILAALGLVLLAVSLLLSRSFARQIAGPLGELTRGTELVAEGDLEHRVRVQAVDELGDLIEAFNRMTAELKSSKDELVRAERIAAWQGIARRLAHEIKNPLTPIGLSMHRIRSKVDDPVVVECIDTVLEETENLKRLADEFSLYGRLPAPAKEPLELAELLRGLVSLYAARTSVDIQWDGWEGDVWINADPGQIRQVFSNVVKNAIQAMDGQGTLTLRVRRDGERLRVLVADTGPGLPVNPEGVFEPYFTTKESGTGLGLAVARKIVEDHGGHLLAKTADDGRGAAIEIDLPGLPANGPGQ